MKSYIDFFETYKGEMLAGKRFRNRFIRRWGTETIDGVKVMKKRFTVYPGHLQTDSNGNYTKTANNIQNFCKMLGSWNQVKEADFSPIAGYYFWLNPNKNDTSVLEKELLAEKIDMFCPKDVWQEYTINYIDKNDPTKFDGWSKEQILTYIDNDYANIFSSDNGFIIEDDIDKLAIGQYVLFDDGTEFAVEVISSSRTAIQNTPGQEFVLGRTKNLYYTGLNVAIRYKRIVDGINPDGALIAGMLAETNGDKKAVLQELQRSSINAFGKIISTTDLLEDLVWYKGRLRYSAVIATGVKTKTAVETILSTLDTGTIKKKVKWYKKVLGFVLIVVAIAIAVVTAGAGAPLSAVLTSIAIAVGIATLVMTLIQAQWAKSNAAAASYMGRWVKIANIISIVAGITAVIANIAKTAAAQSLAQAATAAGSSSVTKEITTAAVKEATAQVAKMTFTETLQAITFDGLMSAAGDMLISSWKSIGMKVAGKAIEMRQAEIHADLVELTAQAEDTAEALAEMTDRNMNIGVEDIKWYTDLSSQANTRYDFNAPYEAEPSVIHIGNICKASFYNGARMNLRAEDLLQIK